MTLTNNSCLSTAHYNFGVSLRSHFDVYSLKQIPCLFMRTSYSVGLGGGRRVMCASRCQCSTGVERRATSGGGKMVGGRRHKALAHIPGEWGGGGGALRY